MAPVFSKPLLPFPDDTLTVRYIHSQPTLKPSSIDSNHGEKNSMLKEKKGCALIHNTANVKKRRNADALKSIRFVSTQESTRIQWPD
jgi:hypothetical protein